MPEDAFSSLSFIAGPAILTNACAILQNGVTTRYNLAITQWRDFRAAVAAGDDRVERQYVRPDEALALAGRRVRLQLRSLTLLNTAVGLFAGTTVLGLVGGVLARVLPSPAPARAGSVGMPPGGGAALIALLAATATFFLESACGGALLRLHRDLAH